MTAAPCSYDLTTHENLRLARLATFLSPGFAYLLLLTLSRWSLKIKLNEQTPHCKQTGMLTHLATPLTHVLHFKTRHLLSLSDGKKLRAALTAFLQLRITAVRPSDGIIVRV